MKKMAHKLDHALRGVRASGRTDEKAVEVNAVLEWALGVSQRLETEEARVKDEERAQAQELQNQLKSEFETEREKICSQMEENKRNVIEDGERLKRWEEEREKCLNEEAETLAAQRQKKVEAEQERQKSEQELANTNERLNRECEAMEVEVEKER